MSAPIFDFSWNAAKANSNLVKHRVGFTEATTVLHDPLALTVFDPAHSGPEDRWFTLGQSAAGRLLAVSHTYDETDAAVVRIRLISARVATRREREQYERTL